MRRFAATTRFPILVSALILVAMTTPTITGLGTSSLLPASAAVAAPTWGDAIDVPGAAALGAEGSRVATVSCAGPGHCSAGGRLVDGSENTAFIVDQVDGVWGMAMDVPGLAALPDWSALDSQVLSIACAPDGGCLAVGSYETGLGTLGFATRRIAGTWGDAVALPNLAALATGGAFEILGSSCSSGGNCTVVGSYYTAALTFEALLVDLVGGVWQNARNVPGLVAMNTDGNASLESVSCPADGQCSATGRYKNASGVHGIVVDRLDGVWSDAIDIPGLAILDDLKYSLGTTISCATPGECSVGGRYAQSISGDNTAFIVDRVAGVWGTARPVFAGGTGASEVTSMSCPSVGRCHAVGLFYVGASFSVFVVERVASGWEQPTPLPGIAALNTSGDASSRSISCAAPGECAVTGRYTTSTGQVAFVANLSGGTWGDALPVPGLTDRRVGVDSGGIAVACPSPVRCVAVGNVLGPGSIAGFLVDFVDRTDPGPAPVPPSFTG